jgi:hypothetical protein
MGRARQGHPYRPLWLEAWYVFALTATGVGAIVLLLILAALAVHR